MNNHMHLIPHFALGGPVYTIESHLVISMHLKAVRATLHPKLYCAKGGVDWGQYQPSDKPQPQTAFSGRFFR